MKSLTVYPVGGRGGYPAHGPGATGAGRQAAVVRGRNGPRRKAAARYDYALLVAIGGLLCLGLVMVASSSIAIGDRLGQPLYYFWRQSAFVLTGLLAGLLATRIPAAVWQRLGAFLLLFGILMLVLVLIPGIGREVNGSMRWFSLGPVNMQPSELVKLFVVIYLAGYLVRRAREVRTAFSGFFKPLLVILVIAGLLLLEPDYGATVVLFATVLGMLFLGGVPLVRFLGLMTLGAAAMSFIVMLAPYRIERLKTFMDPWADPFNSGFQLTQALIAIGRGEWFGVGLGASVQKLFYLPEAHTDFLFAVLAEELGLLGMAVVIGLFLFIAWRAFAIGQRAEALGHLFSAYVAYGIGLRLALEAFINIAVNLGVLPTKGLPLPLMSYGGSSMVATCLALGILIRLDHELRVPAGGR